MPALGPGRLPRSIPRRASDQAIVTLKDAQLQTGGERPTLSVTSHPLLQSFVVFWSWPASHCGPFGLKPLKNKTVVSAYGRPPAAIRSKLPVRGERLLTAPWAAKVKNGLTTAKKVLSEYAKRSSRPFGGNVDPLGPGCSATRSTRERGSIGGAGAACGHRTGWPGARAASSARPRQTPGIPGWFVPDAAWSMTADALYMCPPRREFRISIDAAAARAGIRCRFNPFPVGDRGLKTGVSEDPGPKARIETLLSAPRYFRMAGRRAGQTLPAVKHAAAPGGRSPGMGVNSALLTGTRASDSDSRCPLRRTDPRPWPRRRHRPALRTRMASGATTGVRPGEIASALNAGKAASWAAGVRLAATVWRHRLHRRGQPDRGHRCVDT